MWRWRSYSRTLEDLWMPLILFCHEESQVLLRKCLQYQESIDLSWPSIICCSLCSCLKIIGPINIKLLAPFWSYKLLNFSFCLCWFVLDLEKTWIRRSVEQRIRDVLSLIRVNFSNVLHVTFNLLYVSGCVGMKQWDRIWLTKRCQLAEGNNFL